MHTLESDTNDIKLQVQIPCAYEIILDNMRMVCTNSNYQIFYQG